MGIVLALLPAAGHDQLWCLYVAGRMLNGARLYGPEIFESNPPLIMWLSELPVALARVLHVESTLAAKLLTLIAFGACYRFTLICLRRLFADSNDEFSASTLAAPLAVFFALAGLCVPARDFGQREHLLSFLVLPYLVLAADKRRSSIGLRTIAGIVAAVGICLKPQQALLPLMVEALLIVRARSFRSLRRPEPWTLLSACGLYVVAIRGLTPEYFSQTLPILRETYWAIGHLTGARLVQESWQLQLLACISIGLLCGGRVRHELFYAERNLAQIMLAAGLGADLAYLQQGTGWYYQQLPALVCFLAVLMLITSRVIAKRADVTFSRSMASLRWPVAALSLVAVFLTLHFSGYPINRERAFALTSPDPEIFRGLPAGAPVAILTTSVDEAMMPVAAFHFIWAQRTNNLWWLPAILRGEAAESNAQRHLSPSQVQELGELQRRNTAEDLERWRPTLLLMERCQDPAVRCQVIEDLSPDLLHWFSQDEAFRRAFSAYRFERTDGRFNVYRRQVTAP